LCAHAAQLPAVEEGFVIRYASGHRIKVKGDEYRRIHALISNCTPLAIWEALAAGDDMDKLRRELPEEFWDDFDAIRGKLIDRLSVQVLRIEIAAEQTRALTDKELGLTLNTYPEDTRRFLFAARKGNILEGRTRENLFRTIRPTANQLAGYTPSYAMHRVQEEE